ncbi:hypothetical protein BK664_13930 [Pseudomonas brassicacearum]|uniref:Uncharacterized protein n=1 Tax=Pseudomonas brassicacearum TaxID=930166 RepID=A0A423JL59_9PSED|nr:hypothetical protein BK664_13930 [Pseudomonas brassicacearum]
MIRTAIYTKKRGAERPDFMKTDRSNDEKPVERDSGYAGGSILSSTRFAVISATMMLFEMPNRA